MRPTMPALMLIVLSAFACANASAEPAGGDVRPSARPAVVEEGNPHLWQPRVRQVAVFKNGLGFFTREGEVRLREGWCVSAEAPPATFGTLAIYSHDEQQLVDVVGSGPGEKVHYDLVTLRGELSLRNLGDRGATVEIDTPTVGRPLDASDGGTTTLDATKLRLLERSGRVRWRIELSPKEKKTLAYTYERYVPSN